ncbi:MAG TPA: type II secretion system protein [Pyrinomonadaceae bacterium]|nr:type II secretion system protein [Pyrinomonadaceae bacterium]
MKAPLFTRPSGNAPGFSLLELLIVVVMAAVLVGFALTQIARAKQNMTRANTVRELTSYLEKARLDSVRRHATTSAQMAQVVIINANFYSVALDANGDGTVDTPRVIAMPADSNLTIQNGTFPRTIMFNWRGRTVDSTGNTITPENVSIGNSYGSTTLRITNAGQTAIDYSPATTPVANQDNSVPQLKDTTLINH